MNWWAFIIGFVAGFSFCMALGLFLAIRMAKRAKGQDGLVRRE